MEEVLGGRDKCWASRRARQGWLVGSDLVHSWFLLSLVLGSSLRPQSLQASQWRRQASSPLPSIPPVKQQGVRPPSSPLTGRMFPCGLPLFPTKSGSRISKEKSRTSGNWRQAFPGISLGLGRHTHQLWSSFTLTWRCYWIIHGKGRWTDKMRHRCGLTEASVFSHFLCFLQEGASLSFCPSAKAPLYFVQYFVQHSESTPTQNTCPENKLRKHLNSEFQYWWKEKQVPENHISSRTHCCDRKAKAKRKLPVLQHTIYWIMKISYVQAAELLIQIWADLRYTFCYMKATAA